MAIRHGMRMVSVWGSGCPFPQEKTLDAMYKKGVERVQVQVISEAKAGDIVIVANQFLSCLSNDEEINAG